MYVPGDRVSHFNNDSTCEYTQKNKRKKAKNNRKKGFILISVLLIIIITAIMEFVFYDKIKNVSALRLAWGILITFIPTCIVNGEKLLKHEGENILENISYFVRSVFRIVTRQSVMVTVEYVTVLIVISMALCQKKVYERSIRAVKIAAVSFVEYDVNEDYLKKDKVEELPKTARDWIEKKDEEVVKNAEELDVTEEDKEDLWKLSNIDRREVFFTAGDYKIEDWDNLEGILNIVLKKISECRMHRKNVFDLDESENGAPDYLKDEICKASEEEERGITIQKKREILDLRLSAYNQYPKRTLAVLISNAYQELALAIFMNLGERETIIYYYGKSICYRMEAIQFSDATNEIVKENLKFIAKRYEDIVFITQGKGVEAKYASKLQKAFEEASLYY